MSWFNKNEIQRIQIEITNYCNASCHLCSRENKKVKFNNNNITLNQIKKSYTGQWPSLTNIHLCGNVDEPTINPEIIDIIYHLSTLNNNIKFNIATNGGTRNEKFWSELGSINNVMVTFGIDGLKDTNHLYRKNVKWGLLEKNYKAFIRAGGKATWQFIPFEHNKHQISEAKDLAMSEGFSEFIIRKTIRENTKIDIDVPTGHTNER